MGTTQPSTSAKVARALGTSLGVLAGSVAIVAVLLGLLWLVLGSGGDDSMVGIIYVAGAIFGLPITYLILSAVAVSRAPEKRTASAFVGVLLIPIVLVGVGLSMKSAQARHENNAKAVFEEFTSLGLTGTPLIYTEGREGCTLGHLTASDKHEQHKIGFDWINDAVGTVGQSNGWNTTVAHVVDDRSHAETDEEFSLVFSTRDDAVVLMRTNYLTALDGRENAFTIVKVWAGECAENLSFEQAADFAFGRELSWSNQLPTAVPNLAD